MRTRMIIGLAASLLLAGCAVIQAPVPEPTLVAAPSEPLQDRTDVIAEAVVEPVRSSELRFKVGGMVTEILVDPGDDVQAGEVIVRIDATDEMIAVEEEKAALAAAQANLALINAGPLEQEIAEAEAELEAAERAISQAVAQRDQLSGGVMQAAVAGARAALVQAETEYTQALRNRDQVYAQYGVDTSSEVRGYMDGDLTTEDRIIQDADYAVLAAQKALTAAEAKLRAEEALGPRRLSEAEARIRQAEAERDVSQALLNLLTVESADWEVASAEAEVEQARARLANSEIALERTVLKAPFDGVVTRLNVEVGSRVMPGEPVSTLATLGGLQVRTIDLTEADVVSIQEGQPAIVTLDALPGQPLSGHVRKVGLRAVEYRGDMTYPIIIELDETVSALRWGMTALVEIKTEVTQGTE